MNQSQRDIKGETFSDGVPDREHETAGQPNLHYTEPSMFESILRTIVKPFRKKPQVGYNTSVVNELFMVTVWVKWYVMKLQVNITVDTESKSASFNVLLNGKQIAEEQFK